MNKKTINSLRKYYELPKSVTDDEIIKVCRGSLGEARINLHLAVTKLIRCLKKEIFRIVRYVRVINDKE